MVLAACVVLFHTMHVSAKTGPLQSTSGSSARFEKPSPFGNVVTNTTPPDAKLSPEEIVKTGNRSMVIVAGYDADDNPVGRGAGYVYSANGIIVTSYSAIRGASSVVVETATGDELNVIALMGYSTTRDVAVLAVLEGNLPALETGAGDVVEEGDNVVVLQPGDEAGRGTIGTRRAIGGVDLMQISVRSPDGCPVISEHGRVIGLTTRRKVGQTDVMLATPTRYISDLLAEHRAISFGQMLEETQNEEHADGKATPSAKGWTRYVRQ